MGISHKVMDSLVGLLNTSPKQFYPRRLAHSFLSQCHSWCGKITLIHMGWKLSTNHLQWPLNRRNCICLPNKWNYHFLSCYDIKLLKRIILICTAGFLNVLESFSEITAWISFILCPQPFFFFLSFFFSLLCQITPWWQFSLSKSSNFPGNLS